MSIGPKVTLTGSADKFIWIYLGFFAVIVLGLVYLLGRSVGKKAKTSVLQDEIQQGGLSFSGSQYQAWADILESAMFRPGTQEQSVYNIFRKMKTADDVKALIVAFGSRRQELQLYTSSLGEWLNNELDEQELADLNKILSDQNINFSF